MATLNEALLKYPSDDRVLFNLTGGTKPMSLAAYQLARQRQSPMVYLESEQGKSLLHYYVWDENAQATKQHLIEVGGVVSVRDFLIAHCNRFEVKGVAASKFEQAVHDAIRQRLPDVELAVGVELLGNAEIDILAKYRNQFAVVECKTGHKARSQEALRQLNLIRQVLGVYTSKLAVQTEQPSENQSLVYEATRTEYVVLSFASDQLSEQDKDRLEEAVRKALYIV